MDSFKPQETYFDGILYRSKNEAKWACFFDRCGIKYFYEPETFIVNNEIRYRPDFYLPEYEKYVEVKSSYEGIHNEEMERKLGVMIDFEQTKISNGLILLGSFPYDVRIMNGLCLDMTWLYCHKGVVSGAASMYDNGENITIFFHKRIIDVGDTYRIPISADPTIKIRKLDNPSTKLYEAVKYVNNYQFNKEVNYG